jgi:hypothetical protein
MQSRPFNAIGMDRIQPKLTPSRLLSSTKIHRVQQGATVSAASVPPTVPATRPSSGVTHTQVLKERLIQLQLEAAHDGIKTSPAVLIEIEDIEHQLAALENADASVGASAIASGRRDALLEEQAVLQKRLDTLRLQAAAYGSDTSREIKREMKTTQRRLTEIDAQLTGATEASPQ